MADFLIGACVGACIAGAMIFITDSVPLAMQGSTGLFLGTASMWLVNWWLGRTDPG